MGLRVSQVLVVADIEWVLVREIVQGQLANFLDFLAVDKQHHFAGAMTIRGGEVTPAAFLKIRPHAEGIILLQFRAMVAENERDAVATIGKRVTGQQIGAFFRDEGVLRSAFVLERRQRLEPDFDQEVLVVEVQIPLALIGEHGRQRRPLAEAMRWLLTRGDRGKQAAKSNRQEARQRVDDSRLHVRPLAVND